MAQSQQSIPQPKDLFSVTQWKWGIDKGSPRWRQLFFDWIFLPFLGWSYKLGIPTPMEVIVESDEHGNVRRTYRWYEQEGIFEHEDQADAGCLDEHWGYTQLPYGRLMPPGTGQYSGTVFPRKKKGARRWERLKFPFVIKDRARDEQEAKQLSNYIAKLNQALD